MEKFDTYQIITQPFIDRRETSLNLRSTLPENRGSSKIVYRSVLECSHYALVALKFSR
jgi:hypothetical protein